MAPWHCPGASLQQLLYRGRVAGISAVEGCEKPRLGTEEAQVALSWKRQRETLSQAVVRRDGPVPRLLLRVVTGEELVTPGWLGALVLQQRYIRRRASGAQLWHRQKTLLPFLQYVERLQCAGAC